MEYIRNIVKTLPARILPSISDFEYFIIPSNDKIINIKSNNIQPNFKSPKFMIIQPIAVITRQIANKVIIAGRQKFALKHPINDVCPSIVYYPYFKIGISMLYLARKSSTYSFDSFNPLPVRFRHLLIHSILL